MAYHLEVSSEIEELFQNHVGLFRGELFASSRQVVVQNSSMAQWIKLKLAAFPSGALVPDFSFPDELIRTLLEKCFPILKDQKIVFMDDLKTLLFFKLKLILTHNPPAVWAPLVQYVKLDDSGSLQENRLYELGNQIAGLFHNYSVNAPEISRSLKNRIPPASMTQEYRPSWEWQSELWNILFQNTGLISLGESMSLALENLSAGVPASKKITLIGSAFLSPLALNFLKTLAENNFFDLDHLLLLPGTSMQGSRLISLWGAYGKYTKQLQEEQKSLLTRKEKAQKTLLQALQSDLFLGKDPPSMGLFQDNSLSLINCISPFRELECFKERLLQALAEDPSLSLDEVALLAPDLTPYRPFLETVFSGPEKTNLTFNVIDLKLEQEKDFYYALDYLMSLYSKETLRADLFTLFHIPGFQKARNLTEEDVELWLEFSNLTASYFQKKDEKQPNSWSLAWQRVLDGIVWDEDPEKNIFSLPFSSSDRKRLGSMMQALEHWGKAQQEILAQKTLRAWITWLKQKITKDWSEDDDSSQLWSRLYQLAQDLGPDNQEQEIQWAGFQQIVKDQTQDLQGRRGRFLTQGFHIASLKPLRTLPFRIIALLGMNEAQFPAKNSQLSFDLRHLDENQKDLGETALDRYTFWETFMSARDALWIFYQGRNPVTGDKMPPSSVIEDLKEYLQKASFVWQEETEAIHAFSPLQKQVKKTFSSKIKNQYEACHSKKTSNLLTPGILLNPSPHEDSPGSQNETINLSQFSKAFLSPGQFYVNRVYQTWISLQEDSESLDQEPLGIDFFSQRQMISQCFWAGFSQNQTPEQFLKTWEQTQLTGPGVLKDNPFLQAQNLWYEKNLGQFDSYRKEYQASGFSPCLLELRQQDWFQGINLQDSFQLLEAKNLSRIVILSSASKVTKASQYWRFAWQSLPLLQERQDKTWEIEMLGPGERQIYKLNPNISLPALFQATKDYAAKLYQLPQPFYPDLIQYALDNECSDMDEIISSGTEPGFQQDYQSFSQCPYMKCFQSSWDDLMPQWQKSFDQFYPLLFKPLSELWAKEDKS